MLYVLCCWGVKVVSDPFEHILGCMHVEELRCVSWRKIGVFWHEAEQGSALLMNPASAAEEWFGRRMC